MNLVDYIRILVRRGWIMILLAVITAAGGYLFSQQQTPVYRASQKVLMVPSRSDFGLIEAMIRQLNSRVAYLQSELVANQVIDTLQLDMEPAFLNSRATIAADQLSLLIQIDVDLEDGNLANDVARTWGSLLVQYQNDLNQQARREDRIQAQLQDNPRFYQLRPNTTVNTLVGGVVGFFLGGIIIFVLEYLESSMVRRREDLEANGLPVLASVPTNR